MLADPQLLDQSEQVTGSTARHNLFHNDPLREPEYESDHRVGDQLLRRFRPRLLWSNVKCLVGAMTTDIRAVRLQLHPIDVAEAKRIAAQSPGPSGVWVDDFPSEGDVGAVGAFLRATAVLGEQQPFCYS